MTAGLSASGARIGGDDYQHLFAWLQVAKAVGGANRIVKIGIEDPDAGNADDVTVYTEDGRRECYQVKYSVDGRQTLGMEWLIKPPRPDGQSPIQGFYRLWAGEQVGHKSTITLVTNRLPPAPDRLMSMVDGRDRTVAHRLQQAGPRSTAGIARRKLAEHLDVSEGEVVSFLRDIRFELGIAYGEWAALAKQYMFAGGLRHDEDAVARGMEIVRGWVTKGTRNIDMAEMQRMVEPLKQPGNPPTASILVQAIDRDSLPEDDTIVLDWADLFPGDEPRVRRQPLDPSLWNDRFRPELHQAALDLRAQGHAHILVKGYMRLPTWFAVGTELGKTAGFQVSSFQDQAAWSSIGGLSDINIGHTVTVLGSDQDLAVGIALAYDPSPDVLAYLRGQQTNVGRYACILPSNGVSNQAIGNAAEARCWAYEVRDLVRQLVREYETNRIHLFLAGPHGAILLLGHLWDHIPNTQIYEDLGSPKGYTPSYLIPG